MSALDELKELLRSQFKPPQVFKEHCMKLKRHSKRTKLARKVANSLYKMDRRRRRSSRSRHRKRVKRGLQ